MRSTEESMITKYIRKFGRATFILTLLKIAFSPHAYGDFLLEFFVDDFGEITHPNT